MTDLVERLRSRYKVICRICGHMNSDMSTVHAVLDEAADEIERLRAALVEISEQHQPIWVSEAAKAAGKEPWVCVYCGTADGSWPCTTKIIVNEAGVS